MRDRLAAPIVDIEVSQFLKPPLPLPVSYVPPLFPQGFVLDPLLQAVLKQALVGLPFVPAPPALGIGTACGLSQVLSGQGMTGPQPIEAEGKRLPATGHPPIQTLLAWQLVFPAGNPGRGMLASLRQLLF